MIRLQHCHEPIAIIGMGCRFPGPANDARSFWHLLTSGIDAIRATPPQRWSLQKFYSPHVAKPGKTHSQWGGYVEDLELFDPALFGISPREAAGMDPQQRMLLEVAYRAIEDAGQPLEQVAGQAVSVFVGISSFDYAVAGLSFQDRGVIDTYSNTGGSSSIAANRISYCFDLRGPSVAVDTACSSSLVAVHLACESIWRGDAPLALAGGVNALLLPDFYVAFSQLGVLSPDGRCKAFDARANGYVRSEGAGMVLLKPLSAALHDKDAIYAVIRGTALNQDGRTPGMTVPSQAAQEQLIRAACDRAGVSPSELQYIEAHGTGTAVGDPIEAAAIGAAVGAGRAAADPCRLGSVKTNIGHLEAGAGIASLIKVALALHHRRIPAHLHFRRANPAIDLHELRLQIPTQTCPWESRVSRLAGINGFGYGGANAHVILEQAPAAGPARHSAVASLAPRATATLTAPASARGEDFVAPVLLPLSARSPAALAASARQMRDWLQDAGRHLPLAEVAGYAAHRRSHHEYRAALAASGLPEMLAELELLISTASNDELSRQSATAKGAPGVAFVCSGQGPQWWAMGRGLLKYSPAFRSVIKRCDAQFAKYGSWSLMHELSRSEADSQMHKTAIAQPSIFAIQVALAAVWDSWGVRPTAVVGHSVGEIAAAYLSGALPFEDAACVAFHRGRTMDLASSQGAMLAVGLSPAEVPQWLEGIAQEVSIAAINGPQSITISGASEAIAQLAQRLERAGVFCRSLAVEYAFHSPQMDPVRDELLRALADLRPQATHTPLISTVTGDLIEGHMLGADYWWQNVRHSVRFHDAMACLAQMGYSAAVEVGPHPVLAYAINECFQAAGRTVTSVASLNRQQDDLLCITKSLGRLYTLGFDIHWPGFYNPPTRHLDLPAYPFQTQRCWTESLESRLSRSTPETHPLLGTPRLAPTPQWEQRIDVHVQSYLRDHEVRGVVLYPAAAIIETALAASGEVTQRVSSAAPSSVAPPLHLRRVRLHNPCMLNSERPQWIQTTYDSQRRQLTLACRDCDDAQWSPLATIDISSQTMDDSGQQLEQGYAHRLQQMRQRCHDTFDAQRLYDYCQRIGLFYGRSFRGVLRGQRRAGEAVLHIALPEELLTTTADADRKTEVGYALHPALLDSCFHGMIAADPNFDHTLDGLYLPAEIEQVVFYRRPTAEVTALVTCTSKSSRLMRCDIDVFDAHGRLCVTLRGFESRRVSGGATAQTTQDLIYGYAWRPLPLETTATEDARRWIVWMDEAGLGQRAVDQLRARGCQVVEVYRQQPQRDGSLAEKIIVDDLQTPHAMLAALQTALQQLDGGVDGLLYLWGVDAPPPEKLSAAALEQSSRLTALAPLRLVQAWEQLAGTTAPQLAVVTVGGQSPDGQVADENATDENIAGSPHSAIQLAQAPLIGLGRVVISETACLRTRLVDLPHSPDDADVLNLVDEVLSGDNEDEIMWRDGQRWVHRFVPHGELSASAEAAQQFACQLRMGAAAGIDELHYQTQPERALAAGEVEIEVLACGLNFSDVMKALELYPGLPDGPVALGAECAGRIRRVAPGSRWQVGDEVMAVAPGAFATRTIVNEQLVARKPSQLSFAQAAAVPIAFLTAQYALHTCGGLESGHSVLIHAASGGVGSAAMQLAKLAGARILATAGSEAKRQQVRQAGAWHVMDSRSLAFVQQTLQATAGQGVDMVLNSLPGEAIPAGLSVLKPGGRFLEIGKRDIYDDAPLGLYPLRNNLALFAIDLDQLFKQQPQRMGQLLTEVAERFERGELQPLPVQTFPADQTAAAFRHMQQGKHIGKVVVDYNQPPRLVRPGETGRVAFTSDGTYWLAGGLGGFGIEIARWLASRGARWLVLSGRSAQLRPAAQAAIDELRRAGVCVTILPCDISRSGDVRQTLDCIAADMPPLRGVFHTAMVLEDKLMVDLDQQTLERVLRPKLLGGWNLHQHTRDLELEHFVLFSSLSSVFGHAGQANYAAANAALDGLAHYRRACGLPATVINWGHLGEVGYLAEREQLGQRLERQGVLSFSVEQATACLEYALYHRSVQLSVLRIDWRLWRGLGVTQRVSPRFAHLLQAHQAAAEDASGPAPSASGLREAPPEQRPELASRWLRAKTGSLLGIPADKLPLDRGLLEMGLDSLMAVELRNWIEGQLGINVPISAVMRSDSLTRLSHSLCEQLDHASPTHPAASPSAVVSSAATSADAVPASASEPVSGQRAAELLQQLPHLDEDQVAQLLSQLLRETS